MDWTGQLPLPHETTEEENPALECLMQGIISAVEDTAEVAEDFLYE